MKYNHAEAFMLMEYTDADGNVEVIWNSRDGVTPFITSLRSGAEARHQNWAADRRAPFHIPAIGDRVWVTMDYSYAFTMAEKRLADLKERYPEQYAGMTQTRSDDELIAMLADDFYKGGHAPRLIVVDQQAVYRFKAQAARVEMEHAIVASREAHLETQKTDYPKIRR